MPDRVKEKLAELLERAFESFIDDPYCIPDEKEFADHLIANGVTVQGWISVKDRLPKGNKPGEISENVIVRTTDGEVTTGWLDALGSDRWWLVIGTDDSHTCWGLGYVTHWMPLPEAPKGE